MTQGVPHRLRSDRKRSRSGSRERDRRDRREKLIRALAGPAKSWIDRIIDLLLTALLIFAPLAFGTVEAWSESIVLALAGAMSVCVALKFVLDRQTPILWTPAYIPIALYVIFILLQLVPLPVFLLGLISPHALALRKMLMSDVSGSAPITFYRWATWHDLRLVLALAAVFFTVINTYRHAPQITRLLLTVVVVGTAVMLLALAQDITSADDIYWIGPPGRGKANAGPFVTYNHFGQFANLIAGAALALLFVQFSKISKRRGFDPSDLLQRWREKKLRPVWGLTCVVLLACGTIFLCQSRGALIGTGCGFVFVTLALARASGLPGQGWVTLPILLAGIALVLCLAPDAYLNRLETLQSADSYADRLQIVKDLTVEFKQFPLVGAGLGSHEYVYPMYDQHSTNLATKTHAENEYAQMLEETGVVGIALFVWFLGAVIASGVRAAASTQSRMRMAAFGLGFGLAAILVQSFVDFGQHLPGVSVFTAVSCAVIVSLGIRAKSQSSLRMSRRRTRKVSMRSIRDGNLTPSTIAEPGEKPVEASPPQLPTVALDYSPRLLPAGRPPLMRMAGLIATIILWTVILIPANNARIAASEAEIATRLASGMAQNGWEGTNGDYAELLSHAAAASNVAPGNVKYRYSLNSYRWHAISRVRDFDSGNVVLTDAGRGYVDQIVADLRQTRRLCPTFGRLYGLLGELEGTVQHDPRGSQDIQFAWYLAQCNPTVCNLAAKDDAAAGRWDEAMVKFQRYFALSGAFDEVARFLIGQANRADLALQLAKGNIDRLTMLMDMGPIGPAFESTAAVAKTERYHLLESECQNENPPINYLQMLAEEASQRQDYQTAVDCYRKASVADYGNVDIHLALARSLTKIGQIADALREAHKVLRLQSQSLEAKKLVTDLLAQNGGKDTE